MSRNYPYIQHGDGEAAVVDILTNYTPELTAYCTTNSVTLPVVATNLIGYQKGTLWVLVELEGGSYKFLHQKRSRIDITVYGPDGKDARGIAYDVSAIIQASLFAWQTGYKGHGVNYQTVQIETDIFRGNDKEDDPVRYIQSLRLLLLPWSS